MHQRNNYAPPQADRSDVSLSGLGCTLGLFGLIIVAIAMATNSVALGMLALLPAAGAIIFSCVGLLYMLNGREPVRALYRVLVGLIAAGISVFYVVTTMVIPS